MNRDEAIAIIRKEYLCVDRDCDIERSCGKCDLMMPSKEPILEAYKMAIKALEQEPCRYWQNGKCNGNTEVCEDAISRQDVLDLAKKGVLISNGSYKSVCKAINEIPPVNPTKTGWIPVSERVAEFPCLACDIFEQIFIPCSIVVLDSRCYEGKDFAFNVEKFLRGKEAILCGGEKVYEKPREIVAWMPLPKPYKAESEAQE